jgi:hypothetical protein
MAKKSIKENVYQLILDEIRDMSRRHEVVYNNVEPMINFNIPARDEQNENDCEESDFSDALTKNAIAIKLQSSMIDFVYPRLFQLMIDFELSDIGTSALDDYELESFSFVISDNEIYIETYDRINVSNAKECPLFLAPDLNPIRDCDLEGIFPNSELFYYVTYCDTVMNILEKLEGYNKGVKQTLSRAESFCYRIDSGVIVEKLKVDGKKGSK